MSPIMRRGLPIAHDGDIVRVVELEGGELAVDIWKDGSWRRSPSIDPADMMFSPVAGDDRLRKMGVPEDEWRGVGEVPDAAAPR